MSTSRHWADYLAPDVPHPLVESQGPPEVDEAPWLTLADHIGDTFRPILDFSHDPVNGEVRYRQRPHYLLPTDATTLDDRPTTVLVGGGAIRYGSMGGGRNRLPDPPSAGQRLKRSHVAAGREDPDLSGPTSHEADPNGLAGGTGAATPSQKPWWNVSHINFTEVLRVQGRTEREAKRAVKRLFGMPMSAALDPAMRFQRQA